MAPASLKQVRLEQFPWPAPDVATWLRGLDTLAALQALRNARRQHATAVECVTLAGPPGLPLEVLLAAALWQPIATGYRERNLRLPPADRHYVYYLPGPGLAVLLQGERLNRSERRLRSTLPTVGALFVPDLHLTTGQAPAEPVENLLLALLLARRQSRKPWFATWQGPRSGRVWQVLRQESRVMAVT